ncbi:SWIM zinc finger family protein [Halorussus aquaticus]|uniref:SWIM zinc finger family protein n=2 Tax=Halorussus aquaticus TaxID=2953748 RepID=A0ABD5Q6A0_9EURY|nr:SWIM zinc finger family protein [Halorussus aquaticus]
MEFALAPDGVQVRNDSYANPDEHEYLVEVEDELPISCTCPADETYSGACKHRVAVAIRRPILEVATQQQLIADGGISERQATKRRSEREEESPDNPDCDCADLSGDFPCWDCYYNGRRDLPDE